MPVNVVPCGKCVLCLKRKQNSWSFRLSQEEKISTSSAFITFTYSDEHLKLINNLPTLHKPDFQNFLKRLRKRLIHSKIKYFACGEYSPEMLRPHYHAIIYNLPRNMLQDSEILESIWGKGFIFIAPTTEGRIRYTTKYILKPKLDSEDLREKEFSLMSKGIGKSYLTPQMKNYHRENMLSHVTLSGGQLTPLPRYFREKIFDDSQKADLNEYAEEVRNYNFEKYFNSNLITKLTWTQEQRRKAKKNLTLEKTNLITEETLTQLTKVLKMVK